MKVVKSFAWLNLGLKLRGWDHKCNTGVDLYRASVLIAVQEGCESLVLLINILS